MKHKHKMKVDKAALKERAIKDLTGAIEEFRGKLNKESPTWSELSLLLGQLADATETLTEIKDHIKFEELKGIRASNDIRISEFQVFQKSQCRRAFYQLIDRYEKNN